MKRERLQGNLMLLLAAVIWGAAFVAQSVGMDYVGMFTFNAARFLIGALVLLPVIALFDISAGRRPTVFGTDDPAARRRLLIAGGSCGLALAAAALLQQAGIMLTTVGKAGFITALYIIIIPLAGMLFGRRPGARVWAAVGIALGGMYLLCVKGSFTLSAGDLLLLFCAMLFAAQIMLVDKFVAGADGVDGVRLSCMQFLVAAAVSGVFMLIFEKPSLSALMGAAVPLLYTGVLSSGAAYTLQILGQKRTGPVVGSLIMSMESVFAALSGWLLLNERMSARELFGCALMFSAIILAQLPARKKRAD